MCRLKSLRFGAPLLLATSWLLLFHQPHSKLADAQLEAVGALMSVVPVTSILATAGLVGVKLVALSRLLDVLGYDRAYLAQGGSGTAAHPIGLQTKYAYMFPYVPGLNISVRGDDSIGMQDVAEAVKSSNQEGPARKTYPAMGLPGDYEKVDRPFRGSEALQKIFKQAGIQIHLPTKQQQQQLQQQFNLPAKDQSISTTSDNHQHHNQNFHHQQQQQSSPVNTKQNQQQQLQPTQSQSKPQPQHDEMAVDVPPNPQISVAPIPSNLMPQRDNSQPANGPSSSSYQPQHQQPKQQQQQPPPRQTPASHHQQQQQRKPDVDVVAAQSERR